MAPTTRRVCLTVFEATKSVCITFPTLEWFKLALARFHREILVGHPYASAAVLLLWSFYPQFPFHALYFLFYVVPSSIILGMLTCLGFEREGVRADSVASRYQSRGYGGYTPGNSIFSRSQSYGTILGQEDVSGPQPVSYSSIVWRTIGWFILYASLVVLLKYGGQ